jgi:DHA2 family multidrug resistance protein
VFYINVPICVVAGLGITFALKLKPIPAPKQFDFFAFTTLILALGCLQLVLDRGIDQGWFESSEIILEAVIAGLGLYLFVVHLSTVGSTLFPDGLFRDRNFVSGTMLTFVNSCLLIASTALLPPFLQTLGGHTAMDVGMLLAPRGIGTLLAIQLVQRTIYRVDLRYVIIAGTLISTSSFWLMAHWTPDIDDFSIAVTALIQGAGMGFVVIPANIISFATLPRAQRTDGSALQNLARSMGGAIGVSIGAMVISTYSAVVHASIVEHVSPLNRALSLNAPGMMWNPMLPTGAEALEAMASRAATAVAYSDAFFLMFFLGLVPPVVVLLMKKPDRIVVPAEPILE